MAKFFFSPRRRRRRRKEQRERKKLTPSFASFPVLFPIKSPPGVFLRKNVVAVAGRALKANITSLGPKVLPWGELLKAARDKSYVPDFKKAFEHFLLHTGGRGVIDELESSLGLTSELAAPSKETLARFGNTSAASTWYILANIEHRRGVKKGDRVWQLGFGGGFKCNSACWKARSTQSDKHSCWEEYPGDTDAEPATAKAATIAAAH